MRRFFVVLIFFANFLSGCITSSNRSNTVTFPITTPTSSNLNGQAAALGSPTPDTKTKQPSNPQSPIRSVDFRNYTYPWFPPRFVTKKHKQITLVNGERTLEPSGKERFPSMIFSLSNVSYYDLTGDNLDEAIIALTVLFDPHGSVGCILVYTVKNKKLSLLLKHNQGYEANNGLRKLDFSNKELMIEHYITTYEDMASDCCPKKFKRIYYRWDGNALKARSIEELPNEFPNAKFLGYPEPLP